jgi:hypothetical protein
MAQTVFGDAMPLGNETAMTRRSGGCSARIWLNR